MRIFCAIMLVILIFLGYCDCIEVVEECRIDNDGDKIHSEEHCYKKEETLCEGKVKLESLFLQELGEHNIFFIETSGKNVISPREACAVESAARNSGLHVVMVRVGSELDLSDNTTCQLHKRFDKNGVSFFNVDLPTLAEGTPLEGFFTSLALRNSMNKFVHAADATRLLLLNRFGGFYADLDMVIIKDISHLHNVVASDQVTEIEYNPAGHRFVGDKITNAMMHLDRGQALLGCALRKFQEAYRGNDWAAAGPDLLHRCLLDQCGFADAQLREIPLTVERFSSEHCSGVSVLSDKSFFPVSWLQKNKLWEGRTKKDWYSFLDESYAVHFYHGSSIQGSNGEYSRIMRPKYYGARKPVYLTLALDHCPVAYYSQLLF